MDRYVREEVDAAAATSAPVTMTGLVPRRGISGVAIAAAIMKPPVTGR